MNPALIVRIAVDLKELKQNLAQGLNQIETTTQAMHKLATSFQGDKLIQQAHNVVAAVNQIGGAAKLTEAEQARVNRTLTAALEKYAALGKEAPDALKRLAEETKRVDAPTQQLSTRMIALGSFIGTMAADAVKWLGRMALEGIGSLIKRGAEISGVTSAFQNLTRSLGETSTAMLGSMRTATLGLVSDFNLMAAANKAILLGLPVSSAAMGSLAQTALVLGRAMKQDATKSLDDLITALGRSSPMILDNLGLTVKVGEANEQYARQVGKSASSLTDAEKKLAFYNAALGAARVKLAELGPVQLTFGDRIAIIKNNIQNWTDSLAVAIAQSPALNAGLAALAESMQAALGDNQTTMIQRLIGWINRIAIVVVDVAQGGVQAANVFITAWSGIKVIVLGLLTAITGVGTAIIALVDGTVQLAAKIPGADRVIGGLRDSTAGLKTAMWEVTRGLAAETAEAVRGVIGHSALHQTLDRVGGTLIQMRDRMVEAAKQEVESATIAKALVDRQNDVAKSTSEVEDATKKASAALMNYKLGLQALPGVAEEVIAASLDFYFQQQALSRLLQQTTQDELEQFLGKLMKVGETYDIIGLHAKEFAEKKAPSVSDSLDRMSAGFAQLAQIGGGALKGITGWAAKLTGTIKQAVDGAKGFSAGWKQAGEGGAMNFLGGLAGMIPGVGSIVGAVASLFGGLFGKSEGRKQLEAANAEIAKLKEQVIGLYGSTAEAEAIAARLGVNFQAIWGNQNQAGLAYVQQQIDALAEALERQRQAAVDLGQTMTQRLGVEGSAAIQPMLDKLASLGALSADVQAELLAMAGPDFKAMEEAAARYGIAQEQLGQGFWQAKLTDQAMQVVRDFELLRQGGVDTGVVLEGMGPKVAALVQQALQYGVELPAGMRPIVESMIEAGTLVDENGQKLKGLETLTFAETLTQGIDRVVLKLQELIDSLNRDVAGGFTNVIEAADRFGRTRIKIPVEWDVPDLPQPGDRGEPAEGYATGTYGFRDFGPGTMVRLHGREAVVPENSPTQRAAVAAGGAGLSLGRVERLLRDQPRAIAVAVQDAIALARRR